MRNLKRALSLTLASVMLLGMMVVGTSAAAGYDDVTESNNVEAIEVLQAVEVMVGDERGFGPDRPVNRAEMAVVMGKLLNLDYNYYSAACPFNDVYDWARGWVGACYANGIVSGRGEGVYDPGATVTAVEAASMLMRALGYFQYQNDYQDGFVLATVKQGNKIGIFDNVGSSADAPMTRDQVAQIVLNALQCGVVEPDGNTTTFLNPDGTVLATTGKVNYVYVTSNKEFAKAISSVRATSIGSTNDSPIVELGERLYNGDLKLYSDRTDDFGRPSRTWEYDGKTIGTYMKKEILKQEWTIEVKGKDFYDLLGSDTIKDYDFYVTIDGVSIDEKTGATANNDVLKDEAKSYFDETFMAKTYKSGVGKTGKGVLTQVFVDPDAIVLSNGQTRGKVWVSVINTYLAKATADYSEKRDEVNLDVYGLTKTSGTSDANTVYYKYYDATNSLVACEKPGKQAERLAISSEDFAVAESMKKDDIVLVTAANGEIKTVADPEVISETSLSAFAKDSYVINDGTKYEYNTTIDYDPETLEDYTTTNGATQHLKDTSYNLYLDPYGYLIGVEVVDAVKNYIFLTGIDQGTSNLNNKTSEAAGILLDGTFVNFKMNMIDSRTSEQNTNANPTGVKTFFGHPLWNTWCTYTVDKDGVYTLKEVKTSPNFSATKEKAGQYADLVENGKTIDTKRVALPAAGTVGIGGAVTVSSYAYGNDNSVYIVPEVKTVAIRDVVKSTFKMPNDGSTPTDVNTTNSPDGDLAIGKNAIIVSGVESRGTGIDNVDLKTWTKTDIFTAAETTTTATKVWPGNVYTLYDDDNYVIAAIVVGEDNGASKNLVYVNSSKAKQEAYSSADDEWTWSREVISNGVAVDLIEKGSGLSKIGDMTENTWYEVTYKADGSVKAVNHAYFRESGKNVGGWQAVAGDKTLTASTGIGSSTNANFTDNIKFVEDMNVNGKSTYLYEEVWGLGDDANDASGVKSTGTKPTNSNTTAKAAMLEDNQPKLVGSTLYTDYNAKEGFYVAKDVKSVLIQKNDGQSTTTYGEGTSDLEEMLKDLNFCTETGAGHNHGVDGSYLFKISAIMKDGRATVVVIHDWNEGSAKGNDKDRNPGEEETGDIDVYVSYRTTANDASTQLSEETFKMSRASNGRLVLDKATATAKMGAAWKDYFEVTDSAFPKTLTVAEGTSYAEAVVVVARKTKTLTLPEDWEANWDTDATKYVTALDDNFVADDGSTDAKPNFVKVPTGAAVTVTPVAGDKATTHYFYNVAGAADGTGTKGLMVSGNGNLEFTMPSDKAVTLTNDKYFKVTATAAITNDAAAGAPAGLNGIVLVTPVTVQFDNKAIDFDSAKYVKGGDKVKVAFAANEATQATAANADVYVKLNSTVVSTNATMTAVKILENAKTGADIPSAAQEVTISATGTPTGGNLTLAFLASANNT